MGVRLHLLGLVAVAAAAALVAGVAPRAEAERRVAVYTDAATPGAPQPCPIPAPLRPAFERTSADTRLPLSLLLAVATVESSLRAQGATPGAARLALESMRERATALALDDEVTPASVLAGARYLSLMFDRFRTAELALAAYTAGPTAVENAYGMPPTVSRPYVEAVMALWRRYSGCV